MATTATMNGATCCLTVAVALAGVSPAVAQEEVSDTSSEVLGLVGRMSGDGRTSIIGSDGTGNSIIITSGGVGLRLTRTWTSQWGCFRFQFSTAPVCSRLVSQLSDTVVDRDGAVTSFFTKSTIGVPIAGGRLVPYVTGGGGVGYLSERVSDLNPHLPDALSRLPPPVAFESSEIGQSLMAGGGLDVRVSRKLTVGGDVRWLRLFGHSTGNEALDTAQVAMRVRYGF